MSVLSVRPSTRNNSAPTGWIFVKFCILYFAENCRKKFNCHQHLTRIKVTLLEDQYTCLFISRAFLLRIRNVSNKCCRENHTAHFMFNNDSSEIVLFMR